MNKDILKVFGFWGFLKRIDEGRCPFCNNVIHKELFRDDKSREEFRISGLCQDCQDETFGGGDIDDF